MLQEPWDKVAAYANPRQSVSSNLIKLSTYHSWFMTGDIPQEELEAGYPQGMPRYIRHTSGIPFTYVKQLMRFRTGAHHLAIETGRWARPKLPRQHRVCSKCSCTVVEDEVHFLFECPAYGRIREKYNTVLFAQFGGCQEASSTMKHNSDNVRLFMDQEPSFQVAKFVFECMEFRCEFFFVVRQAMAQMPEGCGVKLAYHADGKLERDGCGSGGCVELLSVLLYADDMVLLSPSREELVVMLQVMDKVAASLGLRINASKTEILSIDKDWKEGDVPVQQGPEVVISEGVVKEVSQFKYLGSVLVTDGRLDVELNIRRGKAVGRFKQFEKMWGTKHLSLATKVKCYKAYVLPILLFGSECWSLTKVQSQKLERVHSSCLRSILGVRLSDRHTNEHIRKSCGVATLSAYITANRLRWLGHVGRMEEGRLPHIALFSSLHGDMTRPVGRPRHTWEKCVCADLKVLGQDEGSWEASCQIKSAWRKRLWDLTHPWESQRLVRCRRRTKQAIDKHVERYVVPFSGWEDGGSPVPRWWEPPPAPTRVVLDPAASPPPMCDGSGAGFGF